MGGQARGILREERLPELNLEERAGGSECQKDMGGGIMKSGKGGGAEGGQHVSQDIIHRSALWESRPNVAGDEVVREPGANPSRTLSARVDSRADGKSLRNVLRRRRSVTWLLQSF